MKINTDKDAYWFCDEADAITQYDQPSDHGYYVISLFWQFKVRFPHKLDPRTVI